MPSIQTLIGKRLETIVKKANPGLDYVGDDKDNIPDFEHELFFAEAKASFMQHDYAAHLKRVQIESFPIFEQEKPVIYLVGFHNFADSLKRLGKHDESTRRRILSRYMQVEELFIVSNEVITNIWDKRNYTCQKGHIRDCTLRNSHLKQIINNSSIKVRGQEHLAREYYGIPSKGYFFSMPRFQPDKGFAIGHIMPQGSEKILGYFYDKKR